MGGFNFAACFLFITFFRVIARLWSFVTFNEIACATFGLKIVNLTQNKSPWELVKSRPVNPVKEINPCKGDMWDNYNFNANHSLFLLSYINWLVLFPILMEEKSKLIESF